MKRLALSSIGVLAALLAGGSVPAFAAGDVAGTSPQGGAPELALEGRLRANEEPTESINWSGYASVGTTFTNVAGDWTQPAANCAALPKKNTTFSAFWVGLDGAESNTVEQTGTEADCAGDRPVYYAWYELYPQKFFVIEHPIRAGEEFRAEVTQGTLLLEDLSKDWSAREEYLPRGLAFSSAEWIAEAPALGRLTDFGSVHFHDASASNATLSGGPIAASAWSDTPITLVSRKGHRTAPLASPSALEDAGTAFTIATTSAE
jgi:hypothetical protein